MRWHQFTLRSIFITTGAVAVCLAAWRGAGTSAALVALLVIGAACLAPPASRRLRIVGRTLMAAAFLLLIWCVVRRTL